MTHPNVTFSIVHAHDDPASPFYCSACKAFARALVHATLGVPVEVPDKPPKEFLRLCTKCVRVFGLAKMVGKEHRTRIGCALATVKRFRSNGSDLCIIGNELVDGREMVATWLGKSLETICAACVDELQRVAADIPNRRAKQHPEVPT